jgi:hypothetical protein
VAEKSDPVLTFAIDIPQANFAVETGRGQQITVRAKLAAKYFGFVAYELHNRRK